MSTTETETESNVTTIVTPEKVKKYFTDPWNHISINLVGNLNGEIFKELNSFVSYSCEHHVDIKLDMSIFIVNSIKQQQQQQQQQ